MLSARLLQGKYGAASARAVFRAHKLGRSSDLFELLYELSLGSQADSKTKDGIRALVLKRETGIPLWCGLTANWLLPVRLPSGCRI
jgi:hypothetical protein